MLIVALTETLDCKKIKRKSLKKHDKAENIYFPVRRLSDKTIFYASKHDFV